MISYWQATEHTSKALVISLSRSVIWPPVLLVVLPLIFGNEAVWFCHSISEIITSMVAVILLRSVLHKKGKSLSFQKS